MMNKITEAQALVNYYEAEEERVKQLRHNAVRKLLSLQDEARRNKKLTQPQLKILRKLSEGAVIKQSDWDWSTRYWWESERAHGEISSTTFYGLQERQVIASSKTSTSRCPIYILSDWGREVLAKAQEQPR